MILIPARLESKRLRHKALRAIGNKPMVVTTALNCMNATTDEVVVATDSEVIANMCSKYGIRSIVNKIPHETGTDEIYEAATTLGLPDDEIIVNVQGDYPFVDAADIAKLASFTEIKHGAMATLVKETNNIIYKFDPNIVKAVINKFNEATYFSRAPIPYDGPVLEHVGLYSYQYKTLKRFCEAPRSNLERMENIEHLRALDNCIPIYTIPTKFEYIGVNTEDDLIRANIRYVEDL